MGMNALTSFEKSQRFMHSRPGLAGFQFSRNDGRHRDFGDHRQRDRAIRIESAKDDRQYEDFGGPGYADVLDLAHGGRYFGLD